jgi:uncharacterized protein (UPF0332 family)
MAIINTLQRCLDSPYLFADPEAPSLVSGLLARATERLQAALNLQAAGQGDHADVAFFSYEAMFCGLRALVYARGYREAGLRCLLLACEGLYVRTGDLDVTHIHAFEKAQGLKLPPAEALAAASAFVARAHELLAG